MHAHINTKVVCRTSSSRAQTKIDGSPGASRRSHNRRRVLFSGACYRISAWPGSLALQGMAWHGMVWHGKPGANEGTGAQKRILQGSMKRSFLGGLIGAVVLRVRAQNRQEKTRRDMVLARRGS
jgi:hypothetical protein